MTNISLSSFRPTSRFAGTLAAHVATAFAGLRRWYQDAMQRRALAGLSISDLKDFGYPVDEAPADVAARGRIAGRSPLR
ncbi:hypothetical protein [Mesorhizobium sp. M4B.F.Ca.ET.013.02.1.1]|uniref:hypothetical protein n=1 Tax=Mesorhizobium sp. M4B.F.Ca.ET.013.02.1.1 TaxID=2496755 RepID=UPI000FD2B449|nr:hypothetical protein [Mesorhizobium sp. M4B.F.Ca.ET.013.02.1.1]RUW24690.1 hypothetical protein EOA34_14160 [Mesorhizobium sp. M4B.F.Ca.ET.013.02.1.1]